jgi:ABC-type dipeptide/oligopeptide/nickel transport system permease component
MFSPPPTVTGLYLIDSAAGRRRRGLGRALRQLILPALTMALFVLAPIARMTRASMLQVLSADFVRTARASGPVADHGAAWLCLPATRCCRC